MSTIAALDTGKLMASRVAALETSTLLATHLAALDTSKLMATRLAALDTSKLMATRLAALDTSNLMAAHFAAFDASKLVAAQIAALDTSKLMATHLAALDALQANWPTVIFRRAPRGSPAEAPPIPARPPEPLEARIIRLRFARYLEGREPIGSMAYAILTLLQTAAGGRREVARLFGITMPVLQLMAFFSTEVGDELTVRKFTGKSSLRPHSKEEVHWLETLVKLLPTRITEVTDGGVSYIITMDGLPPLL